MQKGQIVKSQISRPRMTYVALINKVSIRSWICRVINENNVPCHHSSWEIAIYFENPSSYQICEISHYISYVKLHWLFCPHDPSLVLNIKVSSIKSSICIHHYSENVSAHIDLVWVIRWKFEIEHIYVWVVNHKSIFSICDRVSLKTC